MWVDYRLKTPDAVALQDALPETMRLCAHGVNHALDVIGVIERGGDWDESLQAMTPVVAEEGYHANLRLRDTPLPASLELWVIEAPEMPKRVFAEVD